MGSQVARGQSPSQCGGDLKWCTPTDNPGEKTPAVKFCAQLSARHRRSSGKPHLRNPTHLDANRLRPSVRARARNPRPDMPKDSSAEAAPQQRTSHKWNDRKRTSSWPGVGKGRRLPVPAKLERSRAGQEERGLQRRGLLQRGGLFSPACHGARRGWATPRCTKQGIPSYSGPTSAVKCVVDNNVSGSSCKGRDGNCPLPCVRTHTESRARSNTQDRAAHANILRA